MSLKFAAIAAVLISTAFFGSTPASAQALNVSVNVEKVVGMPVVGLDGEQICVVKGVTTFPGGQGIDRYHSDCGGSWSNGKHIEMPLRAESASLEQQDGQLRLKTILSREVIRRTIEAMKPIAQQ
jgi:hypothetical protein